jgi:N-acetylglucosaminyldiphosphoundecaprenol N-acetyl-beta-D-mannosaminyltransferase
VTIGNLGSIAHEIVDLAGRGVTGYVCMANAHMLTLAATCPHLRAVLQGSLLTASDGRPLVWALRRRGHAEARQVRGPSLMPELCRIAGNLPVYFYGGHGDIAGRAAQAMQALAPQLRLAGAEAAPMLPERPGVDMAAVARIRASGARIVFVGLGCPKQEHWMRAHAPLLDAVLIGVGQAFDIAAGNVAEAPAWMQRSGVEWLFRLSQEPRRLWRRYLFGNLQFLRLLLAEELALRSAPGGPAAASEIR